MQPWGLRSCRWGETARPFRISRTRQAWTMTAACITASRVCTRRQAIRSVRARAWKSTARLSSAMQNWMQTWQKKPRLPRLLLRLSDGEHLVCFHVFEHLTLAAGPVDFDLLDDRSSTDSEVNAVEAG